MHTLLDYDCLLPEFVNITDGKTTDNKAAFDIEIPPYSIVVADRGYCDYSSGKGWRTKAKYPALWQGRMGDVRNRFNVSPFTHFPDEMGVFG